MSQLSYVAPSESLDVFTCPHCGANTQHQLSKMNVVTAHDLHSRKCVVCQGVCLWLNHESIYPVIKIGEIPNSDLPEEIKQDYEEARTIGNQSPRGAAALLRLAIQKLCKHLGEPGKDFNTDIGSLVKNGLPASVQQALDLVRVIGNEAVHPGTIDLRDNTEIVAKLFKLVNFIAHKMITEPREIRELYEGLPPGKLDGIENRDNK